MSLHDSHFEKFVRTGQNIELTFDWAKLENYIEKGFEDGLVLGKTKITINGIYNEEFKNYYDGDKWKIIETPNDIVDSWQEVANTEIDETLRKIQQMKCLILRKNIFGLNGLLTMKAVRLSGIIM